MKSLVMIALLAMSTFASAQTRSTSSLNCSIPGDGLLRLLETQRNISKAIDLLIEERSRSDEESARYIQIQIGELQAAYLKCDAMVSTTLQSKR